MRDFYWNFVPRVGKLHAPNEANEGRTLRMRVHIQKVCRLYWHAKRMFIIIRVSFVLSARHISRRAERISDVSLFSVDCTLIFLLCNCCPSSLYVWFPRVNSRRELVSTLLIFGSFNVRVCENAANFSRQQPPLSSVVLSTTSSSSCERAFTLERERETRLSAIRRKTSLLSAYRAYLRAIGFLF